VQLGQYWLAGEIASFAGIECRDMREVAGHRRVGYDGGRTEGCAAQLQSALEFLQQCVARRLDEGPEYGIPLPGRPSRSAPSSSLGIAAIDLIENMPHRAQESDDRNILGLIICDRSHHAVVLREAGNQIADEVELCAGDEHWSQHPKGRLDVGGGVGVVEGMQDRAGLRAISDLDLLGLVVVGEDVSLA
jgi:hypothetical protein